MPAISAEHNESTSEQTQTDNTNSTSETQAVSTPPASTSPASETATSASADIPVQKTIKKPRDPNAPKKERKKKDMAAKLSHSTQDSSSDDQVTYIKGSAHIVENILRQEAGVRASAGKASKKDFKVADPESLATGEEKLASEKRGKKKGTISKPPVLSEETLKRIGGIGKGGMADISHELNVEWKKLDPATRPPWTVYMSQHRTGFESTKKPEGSKKAEKVRHADLWEEYNAIPLAERVKWSQFLSSKKPAKAPKVAKAAKQQEAVMTDA